MPGWPLSEEGTLGKLEGLGGGGAREGVALLSSLGTTVECSPSVDGAPLTRQPLNSTQLLKGPAEGGALRLPGCSRDSVFTAVGRVSPDEPLVI